MVPATMDHARAIKLRDGDAAELAALGLSKEHALSASIERAVWAETYLIDGKPAAIVGLGLSSLVGGYGVPWLLTGPACERHKKTFLRESRRQVARMLAEASPLINFVHADYRRALGWMAWLGFTIEAPISLNGAPFHRCIKERRMHRGNDNNLILRRARRARLEGWERAPSLMPTLRDASLRDAPQGEVVLRRH